MTLAFRMMLAACARGGWEPAGFAGWSVSGNTTVWWRPIEKSDVFIDIPRRLESQYREHFGWRL